MEYKALKDIAKITMGQSPDSSSYNEEKDGLPFFQGNADFGELYPNERVWCNEPKKVAEPGDILISVRAPIGALNYAKDECCIGRGLAAITIEDEAERNYVFHLLKARNNDLNQKGTGSTFKAIGKNVLEEIAVPQISRDEQQKCMDMMDLLESIIRERKSQLDKLDELIRARFVELFGSISNNKFGYAVMTLQDVCEPIKDGTHQTPTYTEDAVNGYKFLSSKDVTSGKVDWNHLKYIPEELHKELYKRISPRKGDILLAKNGTTGVAAIVDRDDVFDIYVSLALLRPLGMVTSEYLCSAVNSIETKHQFDSSLKGIGVPNLHLGEIKKTKIVVPPIEEQEKFAEFVKQVDKSKVAVQKALDEAQLLFDSLMQDYFG
jgi:type I restriction enzyme S subunit